MEIKAGDTVKFDEVRTGIVIQVKDLESVIGDCDVQVETLPYHNKMWFNHNYLEVVAK